LDFCCSHWGLAAGDQVVGGGDCGVAHPGLDLVAALWDNSFRQPVVFETGKTLTVASCALYREAKGWHCALTVAMLTFTVPLNGRPQADQLGVEWSRRWRRGMPLIAPWIPCNTSIPEHRGGRGRPYQGRSPRRRRDQGVWNSGSLVKVLEIIRVDNPRQTPDFNPTFGDGRATSTDRWGPVHTRVIQSD
jgi:hypothetical protein